MYNHHHPSISFKPSGLHPVQSYAQRTRASDLFGRLEVLALPIWIGFLAFLASPNSLSAAELSLGNLVFRDLNNNGQYEPANGETGIDGVVVNLYADANPGDPLNWSDQLLTTTVTGAGGLYRFDGLMPGSYFVEIAPSNFLPGGALNGWMTSDPFGYDPNNHVDGDNNGLVFGYGFGPACHGVQLAPGLAPTGEDGDPNTDLTVDFGFTPALSLGDLVWLDLNNNGLADSSEPGIDGVEVQLWRDNGDGVWNEGDAFWRSVGTTDGGHYRFDSIGAGSYFAVIRNYHFGPGRPLNGLRSSTGNDPAPEPDGDVDQNDDGYETPGFGMSFFGVVTRLITLAAGTEPDSGADGDGPDGNQTIDFGFYAGPTVSFGGLAFRDDNNNGVWDGVQGETVFPNVQLNIYIDNGDGVFGFGDDYMSTVFTDANGRYSVPGLVAGNYIPVISLENFYAGGVLNGWRSSTGNDPAPDPNQNETVGDDNGTEVTPFGWISVASRALALTFGGEPDTPFDGDGSDGNRTVDFGFYAGPTLALGDRVFRDLDNDGVFEPNAGETGVPGVRLDLWQDNGDGELSGGDWLAGTTTTASDGGYLFGGLFPGSYFVVVRQENFYYGNPLTGLRTSTGNDPAPDPETDLTDNDDNGAEVSAFGSPVFGVTSRAVTLDFGTEPGPLVDGDGTNGNLTVDFGFRTVTGTQFVVNSIGDYSDGTCDVADCTLREAIEASNASPGPDTIVFDIPGADVKTIRLSSPLPATIEPVVIDGFSQTGASGGSWPPRLRIELDGSGAGGANGLNILGGFSTIRGLVINHFTGEGLRLEWGGYNTVQANFIGTDVDGFAAAGNGSTGMTVFSDHNLIGGHLPAERNLISANFLGLSAAGVTAWANDILGNYIGTDSTGAGPLGNSYANVQLFQCRSNRVGVSRTDGANVLSAAGSTGLILEGDSAVLNRIQGNCMGTSASGTVALPNGSEGIVVRFGAHNNTIGGTQPGEGNLISGNTWVGLAVYDAGTLENRIAGNLIGTDITGNVALPNYSGVWFSFGASSNVLGGAEPAQRNVISGNRAEGILIQGPNSSANRILGNAVGVAANGIDPLPNGGIGIAIRDGLGRNHVGDTTPGAGNTIAYNNGPGVLVENLSGAATSIRGNAIGPNAGLGIDLLRIPDGPSGVTPNDPLDADVGSNGLQNYPEILGASSAAATTVDGILQSAALVVYDLDFYSSPACDPAGFGEGQKYLGSTQVTTDAAGNASFTVALATPAAEGSFLTATATSADGATSEFSPCQPVGPEGPPTLVSAFVLGTQNEIELLYSEFVDPVSSTRPENYSLNHGALVLSVSTGSNPQSVVLTTSALAAGVDYLLTVQGVTDRATPPNSVTPGSQIGVIQTRGHIARREYQGIAGWSVSDLLQHARFPRQPTAVDYPALFETPTNAGSFYGVQMLGYLHPPVTGDYVFYLAADQTAELYLGVSDSPGSKRLIASEPLANASRQWTEGFRPLSAAPSEVLTSNTRFIEAEDFDFNGGQWLSNISIGMDGAYFSGAYFSFGTAADSDLDWHEVNPGNDSPGYRATTGVETYATIDPAALTRGPFQVDLAWIVNWNEVGDWRNYTRDFGVTRDYYVFARVTGNGPDAVARLDEVTAGIGTTSQATTKLGEFRLPNFGTYGLFAFVPLQDDNGEYRVLSLGGTHTLRWTSVSGVSDHDYLALVPVSGPPPAMRPVNVSPPIRLVAGEKYYVEALMKESIGNDNLAVAWQAPGAPTPVPGDPPIAGSYLEVLVDANLHLTPPATLGVGNLVFRDLNNDGVFQPESGESGIDGVMIHLYRDVDGNGWLSAEDGVPIATTVTSGGGAYGFDGLASDAYLVEVAAENFNSGGVLESLISSDANFWTNGNQDNVDDGFHRGEVYGVVCNGGVILEEGRQPTSDGDFNPNTNLTVDFGFRPNAAPRAIGNLVFRDANADGRFDPADGDFGIDGVVVELFRDDGDRQRNAADGAPVAVTTTGGGGRYRFDGLDSGYYFVQLAASNFGPGGSLSGMTQTPVINSYADDDRDHDSNAYYVGGFGILAAVRIDLGLEPVSEDGEPNTNLTVDMGLVERPGLVLGNLVWHDDGNGIREDGEPGIPGVFVTLIRDDNQNGLYEGWESAIAVTTTDAGGQYWFTGLSPGIYFVRVDSWNFTFGNALFGFESSAGAAEGDLDVDNDDNGVDATAAIAFGVVSTAVNLQAGAEPLGDGDGPDGNLTLDFGFYQAGQPPILSLGNLVWEDLNGDGLHQPGEPGIAGVSVSLFLDNGNGLPGDDPQITATLTDADGHYQIRGLPSGDYFVRIDPWNFNLGGPLYGRVSSPGSAATNSDIDDDDEGVDDDLPSWQGISSRRATLLFGAEPIAEIDGDDANGNQTLDFGFYSSASPPVLALGGSVFRDTNADGHRGPEEEAFAFVAVSLIRMQPDGTTRHLAILNTDDQGRYQFTGLSAGAYQVRIESWNFIAGFPLADLYSSPGSADPNDDVKNDDNGGDAIVPAASGIASRPILLSHGTEPDTEIDGDGPNSNQTVDFGFVALPAGPDLAVGGTLFRDPNENGVQDPGESVFPGITVELWQDNGDGLLGPGDSFALVMYTDGAGFWSFGSLPPGDYIALVRRWVFHPGAPLAQLHSSLGNGPGPIDPDNDLDGDDNGADTAAFGDSFFGVATAAITLRSGQEPESEDGNPNTNLTLDMGFADAPALTAGGTVFRDDNNNGRQDPGENGIAGVGVEAWSDLDGDGLPSQSDGPFFTAFTDNAGDYRISPLPPGSYLIVLRYYNFMPGRQLNGLRSSTGNDPAPAPDTDIDGDDNGFEFAAWNRVFYGIGARTVTLVAAQEPDSDVDGDDSNSNTTVDFGLYPGPTCSVGNQVFLDSNNNGRRDAGEPGIADVHLRLFFDNGDGSFGDGDEDLGGEVITDSAGSYSLAGLPEGDYLVVVPSDNWWPGRALNGLRTSTGNDPIPDPADPGTDDADHGEEGRLSYLPGTQVATKAFALRNAAANSAVDFGFYPGPTVAVGGTVFLDANNDGVRQADESGISSVSVELWVDSNRDNLLSPGDQPIGNFPTDSQGDYYYAGLLPGDYFVLIPNWQHFNGGALTGLRSSTGNDPAPDPDTDVAGDDNGMEVIDPYSSVWFADATQAVTLGIGTEPDADVDGDGRLSNRTVDLGYSTATGITFVVTSADDHNDSACNADCTLREAILAANNHVGTDTIRFQIGDGGHQVVRPALALPEIIDPVILDGTTQPGFIGAPLIELDGSVAGPGVHGLILRGGLSSVRGFIIHSFNGSGILLQNGGGNLLEGNYIGTDATGTSALGNSIGVWISSSPNNLIGGVENGHGNLIAFQRLYAVGIIGGLAVDNAVRGNSIHDNGTPGVEALGIDLFFGQGVTPNDPGDFDEGANHGQNFPELDSASVSAGNLVIEGHLPPAPSRVLTLDFYANAACDPAGYGEGQTYLGTTLIETLADSEAFFLFHLAANVEPGAFLTATATDPDGNTSEFSRCRLAEADRPPTVVSASTRGSLDRIFVLFSEALQPFTATNPANYSVSGEVSVVSATLDPDRRTVTLLTSGLNTAGSYSVTVTGVSDLADPPNVIEVGSPVPVLTVQGVLSRLVYRGVDGFKVSDLTTHPSFPDSPTEITYEPSFEAPSDIDEFYGQKMAGYLTPAVTGDYVFSIVSDDASELWLSTDSDPAKRVKLAQITYWLPPGRLWNDAPLNAPREQVLTTEALFIEAEDFDFSGGHGLSESPIGVTGPYAGGAYADLGGPGDEGIDFHEISVDATALNYRISTGIEMFSLIRAEDLDRGAFNVSTAYKVGWNFEGEWRNYTREFPGPGREYWVYARLASGDQAMAVELAEVTAGVGTPNQTLQPLGEFRSMPSKNWDNFVFVVLTGPDGEPIRVRLGGQRTLRATILPGGTEDIDYLAFVPVGGEPPSARPENQSKPVHLVAGQRFYVETLMKEGGGGDHLAVTWRPPGTPAPANGDPAIPGTYLSSLKNSGNVSITAQPEAASVIEHSTAIFTVDIDGTPPYFIQWYRDDVAIPGGNSFRYTLFTQLGDDGAQFHAVISNVFSSITSAKVGLEVIPDTSPPQVQSAVGGPTLDRITLAFSEPLDSVSATNVSHYSVDGGIEILAAQLLSNSVVRLTTSPQAQAIAHHVAISGVRDVAATPNEVEPGVSIAFTSWVQSRGYALREVYFGIPGTSLDNLYTAPIYPDFPSLIDSTAAFEVPHDVFNDYGVRLSALLIPPTSGAYQFYLASDDQGILLLSPNDSSFGAHPIAYEPLWNPWRAWSSTFNRNPEEPENRSVPTPLQGNQLVFIEALMKEGGGGDNLGAAWQPPGAPAPVDGAAPIPGSQLIGFVNPDDPGIVVTPYLLELDPGSVPAGAAGFVLVIRGKGFLDGAVVEWNGSPRPTTFVDGTQVIASIPASDSAATGQPFSVATLRVINTNGAESNPLGFTITASPDIADAESQIAPPGESATAAVAPNQSGQGGVAATLINTAGDPVTITAATYSQNPTSVPVFDVGGGYADLAVSGGDLDDVLDARFYYPDTIQGAGEAVLRLLWFNGTEWLPARGIDGGSASLDTTDNLDGTVSGGRFSIRLGATSVPTLSSLIGTVFTVAAPGPNEAPIADDDELFQLARARLRIPVSQLLANDRDPDGDLLQVVSVSPSSANGAEVTLSGPSITYRGTDRDAEDSFTYTVADGRGGQDDGIVYIRRRLATHVTRLVPETEGVLIEFAGAPGQRCVIEFATDLARPDWSPLGEAVIGANGRGSFTDTSPTSPIRIYRVRAL